MASTTTDTAAPSGPPPRAAALLERLEGKGAFELVRIALAELGDELRIASSFGVEDMVVLHLAARAGEELGVAPRIFLLDTGRLHQETYDLVDRARDRYGLAFDVYAPDTVAVESLLKKSGPNGFYRSMEDRKECCAVRKLGPLSRALAGAAAWVTGLRRAQSQARAEVRHAEWDADHGGLLKLAPLATWSDEDVWSFVKSEHVPVHPLHAQGYPSIGCAPCTRAVAPGEDARAGRWWWENDDHKECGLHARRSA
jgi:phosphoadenosine phosphosulfate reductase